MQNAIEERGVKVPNGIRQTADGRTVATYGQLLQGDGKTEYVILHKARKSSRPMYAGTLKFANAIDNLRSLVDENGGDLNKWGSDARQKAQELTRAVFAQHQALGLGGFKGPIAEKVEKGITGGKDITSLIGDVLPLLGRARQDAIDDIKTEFVAAGFDGDPKQLDIPDPIKAPKPAPSELKTVYAQTINARNGVEGELQGYLALGQIKTMLDSGDRSAPSRRRLRSRRSKQMRRTPRLANRPPRCSTS